MTPTCRKLALTAHIGVAVGWIGAVAAYLTLVLFAMTNDSDQSLRAAWIAMEVIGWYCILPLALASLLSGIAMSLGTSWGLFRHYWTLISFLLTLIATVVLLQHMQTVTYFARIAADFSSLELGELRSGLRGELLHAGLGLLVLLVIEALNVFKPNGLTAYVRSRAPRAAPASRPVDVGRSALGSASAAVTPLWVRVVGIHAVGVAAIFMIIHLIGRGGFH